jgi:hypothetical protein
MMLEQEQEVAHAVNLFCITKGRTNISPLSMRLIEVDALSQWLVIV